MVGVVVGVGVNVGDGSEPPDDAVGVGVIVGVGNPEMFKSTYSSGHEPLIDFTLIIVVLSGTSVEI